MKDNAHPVVNVVMYHYVFDADDNDFNHLKGITTDMFRSQIDILAKEYSFISALDYLDYIEDGKQLPPKACILSFDDGTSDHYRHVFPILQELGIPGYFSIVTSAIQDRQPLFVSLIHNILESFRPQDICQKMNSIISDKYPAHPKLSLDHAYMGYPYDTKERAAIKYQVNYCWNPSITQAIVSDFYSRFVEPLDVFVDKFYLDWDQVLEMEANDMVIANHSHRHSAYSLLSDDEIADDLKKSGEYIRDKITNTRSLRFFTYPYGTKGSFNGSTIDIVKDFKYKIAFSTTRGQNDARVDLLRLKRNSTSDLPS